MQREDILKKIIDILNKKIDDLKESLLQMEETIKQAPTAMESRSDTLRFELGRLADDLRLTIEKTERAKREIAETTVMSHQIAQGSIVKIEKDHKIFYYIISSVSLEKPMEIDGDEARVVSAKTPIAESLIGKKAEDEVNIEVPAGNYKIKIIEVC